MARARPALLPLLLLLPAAGPNAQAPAATAPEPKAAAAAPAPGGELGRLIAAADAAYAVREQPGKMDEVLRDLEAAEKLDPKSYEVLWRLSRYYYWLADDPKLPEAEKSRVGKRGWDIGDRAVQADPKRAEGWFYASAGVGNFSLAMGIVTALFEGMESKYLDRLRKAQEIDPGFEHGAIDISWGRYYYSLPWPKYDAQKSEQFLQKALRQNPSNVRVRVYLADLFLKEGHPEMSKRQLQKALEVPESAYDAAEIRRYQEQAREAFTKIK